MILRECVFTLLSMSPVPLVDVLYRYAESLKLHHHPYNHKHEKVEIYTQITLPSLTLSCFVVRATSTHRIIIALLTFIVTFTANVIPYEQSVSVFSATSVPSWECRVSLSTLPYLTFNYWSTQGASTHPLIILSASQFTQKVSTRLHMVFTVLA